MVSMGMGDDRNRNGPVGVDMEGAFSAEEARIGPLDEGRRGEGLTWDGPVWRHRAGLTFFVHRLKPRSKLAGRSPYFMGCGENPAD